MGHAKLDTFKRINGRWPSFCEQMLYHPLPLPQVEKSSHNRPSRAEKWAGCMLQLQNSRKTMQLCIRTPDGLQTVRIGTDAHLKLPDALRDRKFPVQNNLVHRVPISHHISW